MNAKLAQLTVNVVAVIIAFTGACAIEDSPLKVFDNFSFFKVIKTDIVFCCINCSVSSQVEKFRSVRKIFSSYRDHEK